MPRQKTRKEKERAQLLRKKSAVAAADADSLVTSYSFSAQDTRSVAKSISSARLLKVDQSFIVRDLLKTVTISIILLAVVIGIYFYLRYN